MRRVFCVLALLLCAASVQPLFATPLLVNQVSPYLDYGYSQAQWTGMTSALDTAFGGSGGITVSGSPLTNLGFLLSFDRLWITARQPRDPGLSATEKANVSAFIATGGRAVLVGENSAWSDWNSSILDVVGGYLGGETSDTLSPAVIHPITAGVSNLNTIADGIASGGTSLFNENVITLWGSNSNVVSMLSVNIIDDIHGTSADNQQYKTNLAQWLAGGGGTGTPVPEPSSLMLIGCGLLVLGKAVRKMSQRLSERSRI